MDDLAALRRQLLEAVGSVLRRPGPAPSRSVDVPRARSLTRLGVAVSITITAFGSCPAPRRAPSRGTASRARAARPSFRADVRLLERVRPRHRAAGRAEQEPEGSEEKDGGGSARGVRHARERREALERVGRGEGGNREAVSVLDTAVFPNDGKNAACLGRWSAFRVTNLQLASPDRVGGGRDLETVRRDRARVGR
jgi:hypothetical protein